MAKYSLFIAVVLLITLLSCTQKEMPKNSLNDCQNPFPLSLPQLSQEQKNELANIALRTVVNQQSYSSQDQFPATLDNIGHTVAVSLWQDGTLLSVGFGKSLNLAHSTYLATKDALSSASKRGPQERIIPMVTVLSDERAPYSQESFQWGLQSLEIESGEKTHTLLGTQFILANYNREGAIATLCSRMEKQVNCTGDTNVKFFARPEMVIWPSPTLSAITLYRGNPLHCASQDTVLIAKNLHDHGKKWLIGNIQENGLWPYLLYPSTFSLEERGRNKDLREAMPARLLSRYAVQDPSLLSLHRKNIDGLLFAFYREKDGIGYMWHENESKLNTNAFMVRAIAVSPLFEEYQDVAQKLGETILAQQYPNGSFRNWYPAKGEPYDETYLTYNHAYPESYFVTFSSGEAILALTELYLKTGNRTYLDAAIRSQQYYLTEYVEKMDENYYPAYVPWHTLSLYNLYLITNNDAYVEAIFTLNNKLLEIQNTNGEPFLDFKGRFYNSAFPYYGAPHASSDGVFTEGVVYAYALSKALGREELSKLYEQRIAIAIENLARLQFSDENSFYIPSRKLQKIEGAMRTSVTSNIIRVDNTQHMLDGMGAYLDLYESESSHERILLKDTLGNVHEISSLALVNGTRSS